MDYSKPKSVEKIIEAYQLLSEEWSAPTMHPEVINQKRKIISILTTAKWKNIDAIFPESFHK